MIQNSQYQYYNLLESIDIKNTILITPNRRLSADLHLIYAHLQKNLAKATWPTPTILSLSVYLEQCFNEVSINEFEPTPYLLSTMQTLFIWEKIIKELSNDYILQETKTAQLALSAWTLLHQYELMETFAAPTDTEESNIFKIWIKNYKEEYQANNYLDSNHLIHYIIAKNDLIEFPKQIIFIGFNEIYPQLNLFIQHLSDKNIKISYYALPNKPSKSNKIALIDTDDEITTMARWAKKILNEHQDVRIGCVIPNLDRKRDFIHKTFTDIFQDNKKVKNNHYFNISAGTNLFDCCIIKIALTLLQLHEELSLEIFETILFTPFIGDSATEYHQRINYSLLLRKYNYHTINLIKLLDQNHYLSLHKYLPLLANRLTNFFTFNSKEQLPLRIWAEKFHHLLGILGWPGERILNSEEYQTVMHWFNLLQEFAKFDYTLKKEVYYQKALSHIKKIAKLTPFQIKTPLAPIQILGLLEAAGIEFDYLWISGMDNISWPPQPKPNPFIPASLQKAFNLPHATADRELNYCKTLFTQFQNQADTIIFSYAQKDEEKILQPSSFLNLIEPISENELNVPQLKSALEIVKESSVLETFIDDTGPAISAAEKLYGGTHIIKLQATCPFRAFSECRLHAHALETTTKGLRPKERGILIHRILEELWSLLKDHETLTSYDKNQLDSLIETQVQKQIKQFANRYHSNEALIKLEKSRLKKLVRYWLDLEKERETFTIHALEHSIDIKLNALTLSTRIDRIDTLNNGKKIIIDYKTSKNVELKNLFGDRPIEPQLPLYALSNSEETIGLIFAQLHPLDLGFKGLNRFDLGIKGVHIPEKIKYADATEWSTQLESWRSKLNQLSDHFVNGDAKVDPKNSETSCNYCQLMSICRVKEELIT